MKNLPLAGSRPLFACILLLVGFLFGCRKDNFTTVEDLSQTNNPALLSANYPISIEEALIYFSGIDLQASNSFQDEYSHAFVKIEPLWGQSFVGHSQLGKEMVIVPLADSSIRILNNGRADAKLLFTKVGEDSIIAQILLYVADSAHHASNGSNLNLATFSGAFAFFDLTYNFQYGIVAEAGVPFLWIDSIGITPTESVPDREGYDCWEGGIFINCPANNFTEGCTAVLFLQGSPCGEGGGGGGDSGNNGNNNDNNTGGSTGNGNGNGNGTGNTYTPPNYWDVMAGQIPLEIFLQQNGTLPEGFSVQLFQQFIDIYNYFRNLGQYLSQPQLQWLEDHPDFVSIIWHILSVPEVGDERALIKPVLTFALQHNLSAAQYQFLVYNHNAYQGLNAFQNEYLGEDNVSLVIQMITEHAVAKGISSFDYEQFSDFGNAAYTCAPCFAIAVGAEYAILKHQSGCNSGLCEWKLYAQATWNVISSGVHLLLDGAGLVPVFGEAADLTNGIIYYIEGDNVNGTLSMASMVPFAGWGAAGTKFARKAVTGVSGKKITLNYVRDAAGKIDFGNSGQLRTVIKPAANHQAHHLIPWASRQHDVVQAAANSTSSSAFHMNEALNGLAVSTSRHNGSHAAYNTLIEQKLDDISLDIKDVNGNIDPDEALQRLTVLIGEIKTAINTTNVPINQVTF